MGFFTRRPAPEYVTSGTFRYEPLDTDVTVVVRRDARRFTARWRGTGLRVTCPPGVERAELLRALVTMAPRLEKKAPQLSYRIGDLLEFPDLTISIADSGRAGSRISASLSPGHATIRADRGVDLASPEAVATVSHLMCRIARRNAPVTLPARGVAIARELGIEPAGWSISTGLHTLGRCTSTGHISLSAALMFLPRELRDYVICHELAHLTELNHSPRFHALCDAYCRSVISPDAAERRLKKMLDTFRWPIVR